MIFKAWKIPFLNSMSFHSGMHGNPGKYFKNILNPDARSLMSVTGKCQKCPTILKN